jgi:hypothetical protein
VIVEKKYLVIKIRDIEEALTSNELKTFEKLVWYIDKFREDNGRPENHYVVINRDEPHFPEVLPLIKGK